MGLCIAFFPLGSCTTSPRAGSRVTAEGGIELARQEINQGHYESALSFLKESRFKAEDPRQRAEVNLLTGDCHLALNKYAAAISAYFRARSANVDNDSETTYLVSMGLAQAFEAQDRWVSAERHFLEAVSFTKDPKLQDRALLRLGKGSLKRGRLDRAQSYRDKFHDNSEFGFAEFVQTLELEQRKHGKSRTKTTDISLPTVLAPEILGRAIWGARRIRPSGKPVTMTKPWRMTVHHAASPDIPPTAMADAAAQMRAYQKFHQDTRGWADIAYHYLIDGSGRIWQGREMKWEGAHAGNSKLNKGNIGVCLMGNFVKRDPTPSQKRALKQLLSWLCETHGIHPRFIYSHRSILKNTPKKSTLCPGAHLDAYLRRIKPFLPRP